MNTDNESVEPGQERPRARRSRRATAPVAAPLFSAAEPVVIPETTVGGASVGSTGTVAAATSTAQQRERRMEQKAAQAHSTELVASKNDGHKDLVAPDKNERSKDLTAPPVKEAAETEGAKRKSTPRKAKAAETPAKAEPAPEQSSDGKESDALADLDVLAEVAEFREQVAKEPKSTKARKPRKAKKDDKPRSAKGDDTEVQDSVSGTRSGRAADLDVLAEFGHKPNEDAEATEEPGAEEDARAEQGTDSKDAPEPDPADGSEETPAEDIEESEDSEDAADGEDDADQDEDEADEDEEGEGEPRLPATALLFQAPVPRRRPRRATGSGHAALQFQSAESVSAKLADAEADEAIEEDEAQDEEGAATEEGDATRRRRRRGGRGRRRRPADYSDEEVESSDDEEESDALEDSEDGDSEDGDEETTSSSRRRRGRRRGRGRSTSRSSDNGDSDTGEDSSDDADAEEDSDEDAVVGSSSRRRRRRRTRTDDGAARARSEVTSLKGSTRLEAKRQRRRESRDAGRRRPIITESEFLARRESVQRQMIVREQNGLNQIAVLEDGMLVEHYVARHTQTSLVGNVYLGRVQNVLPSMEAAFVDIGQNRNAVLYAGEVNWDAAGMSGQPRRIEQALKSGDAVMVQVTKDPIGHKGARLTSQITLAGRYLVLVPSGAMTGISRKLPEHERTRLKKILKSIVPDNAGVIVRTAAEGATEEQLKDDIDRLMHIWEDVEKKSKNTKAAPTLLKGEPELAVRVVRDVFNEDFEALKVEGDTAWKTISTYVKELSPDLADRMHHWTDRQDIFAAHRIDEQLAKGMDRKVYLPSGGSLVIDRTEAMTVIDVNTGKFTGAGGTLEETVTKNNLEAAEEVVRQLRLRDIGGIIVIDFIDMVLEANRDLVLRRLIECLGRDRTRHQVAEVTSLGLVQMTRKRVGQGLVEAFSTPCECCHGRGFIVHEDPVEEGDGQGRGERRSGRRGGNANNNGGANKNAKRDSVAENAEKKAEEEGDAQAREQVKATLATIAKAAAEKHAEEENQQTTQAEAEPAQAQAAENVADAEGTREKSEDVKPEENPEG